MTSHPRITIGVPVFRGEDLVSDALASIVDQTFRDFRVIVSVDGNDERSASVCRRFTQDPRFEVVVQGDRLGWAGNINWIARHASTEFFGYVGQDDRLDPTYYETLLSVAVQHPDALVTYSDIRWFGGKEGLQTERDLFGAPIERMLAAIEQGVWFPFLGLRRTSVFSDTGEMLVDTTDSSMEDVVWVLKVVALGHVHHVSQPLYWKRLHVDSVTTGKKKWTSDQARRVWLNAWMRMLSVALRVGRTEEDVHRILRVVLKRLATSSPDLDWFYRIEDLSRAERQALVADFIAYVLDAEAAERLSSLGAHAAGIRQWTAASTPSILGAWGPEAPGDSPQTLVEKERWLLERDVAAGGWHAREDDLIHGPFRWTGPGTVSEIPLNVRLDGPCHIRVHVIHAMPGILPAEPAGPPGIELLENGEPIPTTVRETEEATCIVEGTVVVTDETPARELRLAIRARETLRPIDLGISDDTRLLGCAVNWIEVEPA